MNRRVIVLAVIAAVVAFAGFVGAGRSTKPPCRPHQCPTTSTTTTTPGGWRNVISSDFDVDGLLPAPWQTYGPFANGGGLNAGYYLPSHVIVAGGFVTLREGYESSGPARGGPYGTTGAGWYQGTLYANGAADSIDHRTTIRMRVVSTNGVTSHRNMPLWWPQPDAGTWPHQGEEDFFESDALWAGGQAYGYFHYWDGSASAFVYNGWPTTLDLSQWHTYRMERLNHKITVWIDDLVTPAWSHQWSSFELPDTTKKPVFQQENPNYQPPAGTTGSEDIQIDSIQIDVPA
jgi:hypothetical protein